MPFVCKKWWCARARSNFFYEPDSLARSGHFGGTSTSIAPSQPELAPICQSVQTGQPPPAQDPGRYEAKMKGSTALDAMLLVGGAPIPNFWYLKVPKEGLYMIRMTWRIILINQIRFLTPIWNPNDIFRNFGLFWLNFHRLRFSLPEGARASILKMTAKSTSVGKSKNNVDLMSFWSIFGKKTTFLLIWVLTSFLKGF